MSHSPQLILKFYLLHILRNAFIICLLLCLGTSTIAQPQFINESDSLRHTLSAKDTLQKQHLRKVIISGNKKTKDYIILREMLMKQGDSLVIATLNSQMERDRRFIYNTTLFVEVKVELQIINAYDFDIIVSVKERWYIFPLPEFRLVDRSVNEWIERYNADLRRVNYGVKFVHYNLSGRKDQLRIYLLNGYTKNISFNYKVPYANAALTNGFSVGGGYSMSREMVYKTSYDNQYLFYKKDNFVNTSWNVNASYSIRKGIRKSEAISLSYTHLKVDDSVVKAKYNPAFINSSTPIVGYVDLSYSLQFTDVNNVLYPLTGYSAAFNVSKRGRNFRGGVNLFSFQAEYNRYWDLGRKWYLSAQIQGKIKLPFNQPYINRQALGYGNAYIRGLEYAVIDGVAFALSKYNFKREILNFSVPTMFKKSKVLNKIPFRIFAKTFTDVGYSYLKDEFASRLNNKLLYSGGLGVDIVTFYDIQIRLEYSFNQLGQNRLFLHNEKGF